MRQIKILSILVFSRPNGLQMIHAFIKKFQIKKIKNKIIFLIIS